MSVAFELRRQLAVCLVHLLLKHEDAGNLARQANLLAVRQQAKVWAQYAALLAVIADRALDPSHEIVSIGSRNATVLSMAADAIVSRLEDLSPHAMSMLRSEILTRPWRWREPVRRVAAESGSRGLAAARLLDEIGTASDIELLRRIARTRRDAPAASLGRGLARRLAPRVTIEDLGRTRVLVGDRVVEGSEVRRKVLALLCLLLTKGRWTATREEVVDSLWPDIDPQSALNSLNQTMYFLRRVFEPDYREETSPGYVQQDGETIWLDPDLIDARSRACLSLIRGLTGDPDGESALVLAREYRGKFALDFAYEEWASPFRDGLHASYLRVMERAVRLDIDSGNLARGVLLAERASEIEPDSEELQLSLVRIYRFGGAHAAAAEQYAHYSRVMKELGVEPRSITEI